MTTLTVSRSFKDEKTQLEHENAEFLNVPCNTADHWKISEIMRLRMNKSVSNQKVDILRER